MTDSFPATERTPSLSCDMSGALGSTLLRRYELAVNKESGGMENNGDVQNFIRPCAINKFFHTENFLKSGSHSSGIVQFLNLMDRLLNGHTGNRPTNLRRRASLAVSLWFLCRRAEGPFTRLCPGLIFS